MRFVNTCAGVLFAAIVPGCSEPPAPARTVSWYRTHPAERASMVARCAEDPGTLAREANCVNARRAAALEDIGSFKDLPPMRLAPPPERERSETK